MSRYLEEKVISAAIKALLDAGAGYTLGVYDGEEVVLKGSTDPKEIMEALFSVDEEYILVHNENSDPAGWVFLVHGNDGPDVISDYTTNLEKVLAPVSEFAESLY